MTVLYKQVFQSTHFQIYNIRYCNRKISTRLKMYLKKEIIWNALHNIVLWTVTYSFSGIMFCENISTVHLFVRHLSIFVEKILYFKSNTIFSKKIFS